MSKDRIHPYRTYKLILEYNGANYNGFQRQISTSHLKQVAKKSKLTNHSNIDNSIQGQIESSLSRLTKMSIPDLRVRGAGRTDKGVHAVGQVVAFDYFPSGISDDEVCSCALDNEELSSRAIARAINSFLPDDIVVREGSIVPSAQYPFEARSNIVLKRYIYLIRCLPQSAAPSHSIKGRHAFRRVFGPACWECPWELNLVALQDICENLEGRKDFSRFVDKRDVFTKDNIIDLLKFKARIVTDDGFGLFGGDKNDNSSASHFASSSVLIQLTAEAVGFRRGMVRYLVGYAVDAARGKVPPMYLPQQNYIFSSSQDEIENGFKINSAPACGLYLAKVVYDKIS